MKEDIKYYFIIGFAIVSILGTLSHYLYKFFKFNKLVGLFCPVSHSIWEHMKLTYFPMLLYSIFMVIRFQSEYMSIKQAMFIGLIIGTVLIPILFYAYTGILGKHYLVADIAIFYISVFAAFISAYGLIQIDLGILFEQILTAFIVFLTAAFWIITYYPPNMKLFRWP